MSLPPRILYVDDEPDNCEMMRYWLRENCGMDVTTAPDGRTAMKHIHQEFFDVYLLDYCLPDTTGVELLKNIRALDPQAPVLIYSALDRDVDRETSIEAGADMYLIKPDEMEKIKPVLDRLLKKQGAERKSSSSQRSELPNTLEVEPISTTFRTRRKHSGIM